jgi:hypothetical protein
MKSKSLPVDRRSGNKYIQCRVIEKAVSGTQITGALSKRTFLININLIV